MEVPSICPHCEEPFVWQLNLRVETELGWRHPEAPRFWFRCASCEGLLFVTFTWHLERGHGSRPLQLVHGRLPRPAVPCIILVDGCPHGCGTLLGMQLDPEDPWAIGTAWPDEDQILGGYRCPVCDGEGCLVIRPSVETEPTRATES